MVTNISLFCQMSLKPFDILSIKFTEIKFLFLQIHSFFVIMRTLQKLSCSGSGVKDWSRSNGFSFRLFNSRLNYILQYMASLIWCHWYSKKHCKKTESSNLVASATILCVVNIHVIAYATLFSGDLRIRI